MKYLFYIIFFAFLSCKIHGDEEIKRKLNPPQSHFEHLKDLDWLVGNWVDNDGNNNVTYHFDWDKNKNFLTQRFIVKIMGNEELSGTQIIGWNPNEKKVVSWTFDSDGGYGQSKWFKEDNSWYISVIFTLPQGGKATATHIIKKIDDNSYTFTSVNREVDGILLPNIGPFKVIRKK